MERARGEGFAVEIRLGGVGALGEERGWFGVAERAVSGFNKAGGSIRVSVARIVYTGSGFRSKALFRATSSGIVSHRICSLHCAGSCCERWMLSCQFIEHRCKPPFQYARPARWDRRRNHTGEMHDQVAAVRLRKNLEIWIAAHIDSPFWEAGRLVRCAGKDNPKMSRGSCGGSGIADIWWRMLIVISESRTRQSGRRTDSRGPTVPTYASPRNRSSNPENRSPVRLLRTARPSAFFCPTSTTIFRPRVIAV